MKKVINTDCGHEKEDPASYWVCFICGKKNGNFNKILKK